MGFTSIHVMKSRDVPCLMCDFVRRYDSVGFNDTETHCALGFEDTEMSWAFGLPDG